MAVWTIPKLTPSARARTRLNACSLVAWCRQRPCGMPELLQLPLITSPNRGWKRPYISCCIVIHEYVCTIIMSNQRSYKSPLRQQQAEATRERILSAMAELVEECAGEPISNKQIAEKAGVTEITIYRHFPSREALLSAVWKRANAAQGVLGGFPSTLDDIVVRMPDLFESFDRTPAHIQSTLTTAHGRALRASQDEDRRAAFLKAVDEVPGLGGDDRIAAAAVLQLLYSAHSWLSLREQWGMSGSQAADATSWAARTLIKELKDPNRAPISGRSSRKAKP